MTQKEQFKAEIEKVKLIIQSNRAQGAFTEGYLIGQESVLEHFENFVNSLQEEPKFKTGDRIKPIDSCLGSPRIIEEVCDGWYVTNIGTLDFEFEDNWELVEEPAGLDKGKLMGMLEESLSKETKESWNKFLQEEPVNKVDVDAAMSEVEAKAKTFTELHKGESSDEILAQMRGEEPVSEDLKAELNKYIKDHFTIDKEQLDRFGILEKDYMYSMDKSDMLALVEHFTNWQKQKDSIVSEDLEKASKEWLEHQLDKSYVSYGEDKMMELTHFDGYAMLDAIEFGANWQKATLWKPADGDDLPEYDREVIAILDYDFGHYKVIYAHRPNPNGWNGTNIDTGEKEHFEPVIYDKGGWNQPHVLYWLDTKLPYEEKN